jgi:DNA-binding transcriptional ArsR family regulator
MASPPVPRMKPLFSLYTPSTLQPELLEDIFVARHDLADQIGRDLLASLTTEAKHHYLLVGPRGIGKTHLVSLLYHRLLAKRPAGTRIAWMREDPWGLRSIDQFVDELARSLDDSGPRPTRDRGESAATFLNRLAASGSLVLFLENADDVFERIGELGEQTLRAFIQNGNHMAICATSPTLSTAFTRQARPFYGTFQIAHLDELTLDEAQELLVNLARARDDEPLAQLIATDLGRRRLQVIAHLAGGHPRLWMLFADAIDLDNLDELVPVFLRALDDLTPYYQDRMRSLPAQQESIVAYLCSHRGAATVGRIAEACDLSERAVSTQLGRLLETGFVRKVDELRQLAQLRSDGRTVHYELREPLMRLCMDVKKSRGEPIRLLVELLAAWFERPPHDATGGHPVLTSYARKAFLRDGLADFSKPQHTLDEYRLLLNDVERILGPNHPQTLTTRSNVAFWTAESGDLSGALNLQELLLSDLERILGPDHPQTLTTRSHITYLIAQSGNAPLLLDLQTQLLRDFERILGPEHPDTVATRRWIAVLDGTGAIWLAVDRALDTNSQMPLLDLPTELRPFAISVLKGIVEEAQEGYLPTDEL